MEIVKSRQTFWASLKAATNGMLFFFRNERNGKIELVISILVLLVSWVLGLSSTEWMLILVCIMVVIGLEMINAALEVLCDLVDEEFNPKIKIIKDVSAGAVLVAAIISCVIGLIIFIPKVLG